MNRSIRWIILCAFLSSAGLSGGGCRNAQPAAESPFWPKPRSEQRLAERQQMVRHLRQAYGLDNTAVLAAMEAVPRHWFVRAGESRWAYEDGPLPIGYDQSISQPYIVALMTQVLQLTPDEKVLEIGTGSGYQAAILNEYTPHVYSVEIVEPLARRTAQLLQKKGYSTIALKIGDGYQGWVEHAPYDAVIVTCAPERIPPVLLEQLKPGGRMVIPVGAEDRLQELILVRKQADGTLSRRHLSAVAFVPMIKQSKP